MFLHALCCFAMVYYSSYSSLDWSAEYGGIPAEKDTLRSGQNLNRASGWSRPRTRPLETPLLVGSVREDPPPGNTVPGWLPPPENTAPGWLDDASTARARPFFRWRRSADASSHGGGSTARRKLVHFETFLAGARIAVVSALTLAAVLDMD